MNDKEIRDLLNSKTITVGEIMDRIDAVEEKTFIADHESYNLGVNSMKSAVITMIYTIIGEKQKKHLEGVA